VPVPAKFFPRQTLNAITEQALFTGKISACASRFESAIAIDNVPLQMTTAAVANALITSGESNDSS
jgi:hypothetical protein